MVPVKEEPRGRLLHIDSASIRLPIAYVSDTRVVQASHLYPFDHSEERLLDSVSTNDTAKLVVCSWLWAQLARL